MAKDIITFTVWDKNGAYGTITIPAPKHWYHRWPLRLVAYILLHVYHETHEM